MVRVVCQFKARKCHGKRGRRNRCSFITQGDKCNAARPRKPRYALRAGMR
jgi:hypothetical protein